MYSFKKEYYYLEISLSIMSLAEDDDNTRI